jgi:hypothetical protein
MEVIRNKVAESGIQVFNLDDLIGAVVIKEIDLAAYLYGGFVLREKEFRQTLKEKDWADFGNAHVGVFCSTDAIIPTWAYMLVAAQLEQISASISFAKSPEIRNRVYQDALRKFDWSIYSDRIVVIKGCGTGAVPTSAYVEATTQLQRVARKIMFGEPCSSVPVWRKK